MKNFTLKLMTVVAFAATSIVVFAAGPWDTKSIHAKAVVVGNGKVYLNKAGEYGGVQQYGTIDENGAYVESPLATEIDDESRKNPYAPERQAAMVYSEYGAYAYLAAQNHDNIEESFGCTDQFRFYAAQLFAVPEEGEVLIGVFAANDNGDAPDYDYPYELCKNAMAEGGVEVEADQQGKYDMNTFQTPDEYGIFPQSEEDPNPAKNINAYPFFSEDGVVDTNSDSDEVHINARTNWDDVNVIYYVVFSSTTTVEGVKVENAKQTGIYDLQGRKLSEPVKGSINVINGEKVLVK